MSTRHDPLFRQLSARRHRVPAEAAAVGNGGRERQERLIQSGARHYSEMLSPEQAPSPRYLTLFELLVDRYMRRGWRRRFWRWHAIWPGPGPGR